MRLAWLAVVACGSSPPRTDIHPSAPPDAAVIDAQIAAAERGGRLDLEVVVLNFVDDRGGEATGWFRAEVAATATLSPVREDALDVSLLANCSLVPRGDATCMARVGRDQFHAKWLLWGMVHGGTVDAQLIPTADPVHATNATCASDEHAVHAAWEQLVAK